MASDQSFNISKNGKHPSSGVVVRASNVSHMIDRILGVVRTRLQDLFPESEVWYSQSADVLWSTGTPPNPAVWEYQILVANWSIIG